MNQGGVVDCKHKGRGHSFRLDYITQRKVSFRHWRVSLYGTLYHVSQLARVEAFSPCLMDFISRRQDLAHSEPRLSGHKKHRGVMQELEVPLYFENAVFLGQSQFIGQIPLIDHQQDSLIGISYIAGNVRILGGQHIRGIQYQEADIRPINRPQRPHHTVCLYAAVYPSPPPDPRRINQQCAPSVPLHYGIDGVASGARQLTDDGPLLSHQRIQEH
ncbi:MAG: hypothetical protein DDT28_00636 [Dehalococcoidia bacterium]|nr:hypothetical protein [Chloroflexota bacterium]